jgi:zinc protease
MNSHQDLRQQPPPPLPARHLQLPTATEATLSNGLLVVIVEDRRLPLVSYRLSFRTGDAYDPPELPGLTDMMTGLLTEGTQSLSSREIAEEIARMGATLTAGANSDYSTVAASSLSRFGDNVLELISDVTLHPSFPENEVELARQNTKESLRQQRAQPSFLATEMVSRSMFGEHPYSVIAPTPESLDAMTRERLIQFHRSQFLPNNGVFIVVGDVRADSLLNKIEQLFGDWEPGARAVDNFPAPPLHTSRAAKIVDRPGSAQSNIVIANLGLTRTDPDYFPMLLMHTVLGANASSRLFMNLREEKGYTYGAYSNLDARRSAGTFRVTAEVRTPVTGDSLKEFFNELERIRSQPVSQKEINDAKSFLTGVFPIRLETQEGVIDQLVQIRMFGLPENYLETYRDRVQAVTVEQIQRVAQKYVQPDQAVIVIVGDGAKIEEQVKPYTNDVAFFNTAGKPKGRPSLSPRNIDAAHDIVGNWQLEIQTPLGQSVPATLILEEADSGLTGRVESEMGNANLLTVDLNGRSLAATLAFDMGGGQTVEAQISGELSKEQIDGSISLQNSPPLTFTGSKQ